jgi:hypothetical protein
MIEASEIVGFHFTKTSEKNAFFKNTKNVPYSEDTLK